MIMFDDGAVTPEGGDSMPEGEAAPAESMDEGEAMPAEGGDAPAEGGDSSAM